MAIDDNTSYELTGAQVKDLANKIKAKAADNIFVGATSAAPGSKGLVPAPQAGDDTKFLSGDGTWKTVSGGGTTVHKLYMSTSNRVGGYVPYGSPVGISAGTYYIGDDNHTQLTWGEIAEMISNGEQLVFAPQSGSSASYEEVGKTFPVAKTYLDLSQDIDPDDPYSSSDYVRSLRLKVAAANNLGSFDVVIEKPNNSSAYDEFKVTIFQGNDMPFIYASTSSSVISLNSIVATGTPIQMAPVISESDAVVIFPTITSSLGLFDYLYDMMKALDSGKKITFKLVKTFDNAFDELMVVQEITFTSYSVQVNGGNWSSFTSMYDVATAAQTWQVAVRFYGPSPEASSSNTRSTLLFQSGSVTLN